MHETNIGQLIHGDLHAGSVVLNVGDQVVPLANTDGALLVGIRRDLVAALKKRRIFATLPPTLAAGLFLGMGTQVDQALATAPMPTGISPGLAQLIFLGFIGMSIWMFMRMQFGNWRRQQLLTVAELEKRIAVIDAELDMRAAGAGASAAGWLRSLFESLRS